MSKAGLLADWYAVHGTENVQLLIYSDGAILFATVSQATEIEITKQLNKNKTIRVEDSSRSVDGLASAWVIRSNKATNPDDPWDLGVWKYTVPIFDTIQPIIEAVGMNFFYNDNRANDANTLDSWLNLVASVMKRDKADDGQHRHGTE